jgi:hypothetical protein
VASHRDEVERRREVIGSPYQLSATAQSLRRRPDELARDPTDERLTWTTCIDWRGAANGVANSQRTNAILDTVRLWNG